MTEFIQPEIVRTNGAVIVKYAGDALKRTGERTFEGHIIRWHNPTGQARLDLTGEWFSNKTYLMRNAGYPIIGMPINYQHGQTKEFGAQAFGLVDFTEEDEIGQFIRGQLKDYEDYLAMLKEIGRLEDRRLTDAQLARKAALAVKAVDTLIASIPLRFSGGFDPSTWIVNEDTKHIDQAGTIHGAFTPTPADDLNPLISFKSAWAEVMKPESSASYSLPHIQPDTSQKGGTGIDGDPDRESVTRADVEPPQADAENESPLPANEVNKMDENMIQAIAQAVAAQVLAGVSQLLSKEEPAVVETLPAETDVVAALRADAPAEEKPEELAKAFAAKAYKFVMDAVEKRRAAAKSAADVTTDFLKRTMPAHDPYPAGGNGNGKNGRIEVNNLKYAHLSPMELGMAIKLALAAAPRSIVPLAERNVAEIVGEDLYKHATQAMMKHHDAHPFSRVEEELSIKAYRPWKAGEIDASATTGAGLEWVSHEYDGQVWELARNNQIYQLMKSRGMLEKPVPDGAKTVIVPVEGADSTVYGGSEPVDLDAAGNPETVFQITPYATANVTVTPGVFRTASAVAEILEEDSLVNNAAEANRKINLALDEHIEKAMLNGDTVTTASTNINSIDGTPTASGLTKSYYLEFNGLMKSPLVTSTAYSRSASGTLTTDDYLNTLSLLPPEQAARTNNLFYVVDFYTRNATLKLSDIKTVDVAGEKATLFIGNIPALWGIPLYMSGHLTKANTSGKVATTTPANNTTGRILLVYAPYWAFSWKRQITIESMRFPQSETTAYYGSMRFCLTRRSASAAAISYNVGV